MMRWIRRRFGRPETAGDVGGDTGVAARAAGDRAPEQPWTLDGVPDPWSGGQPILDVIAGRLVDGELPEDMLVLARPVEGSLRWAPGALDGVLSHHAGGGSPEDQVAELIAALARLEAAATAENLERVDRLATGILSIADPLSRALVGAGLRRDRVAEIGRAFAQRATGVEAVKLGIVLVGMAGELSVDAGPITTLGRHDEFTLYSAVALDRMGATERDLWDLARRVHGWGRIHVTERLARTEDPEIRAWLLRDGFRNTVMDEYLAHAVASGARLDEVLEPDEVDDALFAGASDLLAAMASEHGPTTDLSGYAAAEVAVGRWIHHARQRLASGRSVILVARTLAALDEYAHLPPATVEPVQELRRHPAIPAAIEAGLRADEWADFTDAVALAVQHGIDPFEPVARRLEAGGDRFGYLMSMLFRNVDAARIDEALRIARRAIDTTAIATGPAEEVGLGPGWEMHRQLEWVLQSLPSFPGRGEDLVLAALRSPVVRNRGLAVSVLMAWSPAAWSDELRAAAETAERVEPNEQVRDRLRLALAGGSDRT